MRLVICAVILASLLGCSRKSSEWTAFVYPDREEIPNAEDVQNYTIGTYPSFELCQKAAIERVRFLNEQSEEIAAYAEDGEGIATEADYQCGQGCRPRDDVGGFLVCKSTKK